MAQRGGKKGRKIGRQKKKPTHVRYTNERRWIKNKARKLERHLGSNPNDRQATAAAQKNAA